MNRSTLSALLIAACVAVCGGLLLACGDADDSGALSSSLNETVAATSKIESGRLTASVDVEPDGLVALGGPIKLRASGPFAAPAATGELPRAKIAIAASLGGHAFDVKASSTGKRLFLNLGGRDYEAGDELTGTLREFFAGKGGGFAALGLDPGAWIDDPRQEDDETIGGVQTEHVSGTIDVKKLLDDVAGLLEGSGGDDFLTPKLRSQIAGAIKSAKAEIWSGKDDDILRQLHVALDFAFDEGSSPIQGLDGGKVNLRLRLDDVDQTDFDVPAPKDAQPLSELFEGEGLSQLLGGLPGTSKLGAGAGDDGEAFLKCLTEADADQAAIKRCTSKLGP